MTQRELATLLGVEPQTIRDLTRRLGLRPAKRLGVAGNALEYDRAAVAKITRALTPARAKEGK